MTDEERAHAANGILLCRECARVVDLDEVKFPVKLLQEWKECHEAWVEAGRPISSLSYPTGATQQSYTLNFQGAMGNTIHITTVGVPAVLHPPPQRHDLGLREDFPQVLPKGQDVWCLDFDGIDDYCQAKCPQFEKLEAFRISSSIYPRGEAQYSEILMAFENPDKEMLLAVVLGPYEGDRCFSRSYILQRESGQENEAFPGPLVRRETWNEIIVDSGSSGLRIVVSHPDIPHPGVEPYPKAASLSGLHICHVGAIDDCKYGVYGTFDGFMKYIAVQKQPSEDVLALWDFRVPSERMQGDLPGQMGKVLDRSPNHSDLFSRTGSRIPGHHPESK